MEHARVVIVGAGLAGLRTAERLRRRGYDGSLVVIGAETHLPYDRPPMSKSLLAAADEPELPVLRAADRYTELDLDLRLGVRAIGLDTAARTLLTSDGARVAWDQLVIATGLSARKVPAWSGIGGVHTLRTFEDCLRLREASADARHATVVGAGVLGSEIAATLRGRGIEVALVDPLPQPLCRALGAQVGGFVADLHRRRGVDLHLGLAVAELGTDHDGRVSRVSLTDGASWPTDLVVAAVGGTPDTTWLTASGLDLAEGAIAGLLVDDCGAASVPDVWAVGDIAALPNPRGSGHVRIEHWTSAVDLAATVSTNVVAALGGEQPQAHREVPYMWSDQYDVKVQCLGLPRPDDEVVVLAGSLTGSSFLAAYVEDGRVRAVSAAGMPPALMRCRKAVAAGATLDELKATAPWKRRAAPAPA